MDDAIELTIEPRPRDLGDGFMVRRILPVAKRRHVGPFVFLDHMGPAVFQPGQGLDVRPHPHIGLATVTYLFDGEILHRDSLGVVQPIRPGEVNWMTAGRGIVHSERTAPALRAAGHRLEGIQAWVALPAGDEEAAPDFAHHPAGTLPLIERDGVRLRLIAGRAYGAVAPARVFSPMFYLDAEMKPGAALKMPDDHVERAVYVAAGQVAINGIGFGAGQMAVLKTAAVVTVAAEQAARLMLLGGAPLDGERLIWWNFVASRKERLEQAKRDWRDGRFPSVPGETEFIPLPES